MGKKEYPIQEKRYSEEEAKAILDRALSTTGQVFTREHLLEMADELGITLAQLEEAENGWLAESWDEAQQKAFIAHRRRTVGKHTLGFVFWVVSVYIAYISGIMFLSGLATAAAVVLVFVGFGVLFEVYEALFETEGKDFEKEYEKWLERQEKRRLRAQKRYKKLRS